MKKLIYFSKCIFEGNSFVLNMKYSNSFQKGWLCAIKRICLYSLRAGLFILLEYGGIDNLSATRHTGGRDRNQRHTWVHMVATSWGRQRHIRLFHIGYVSPINHIFS